MEIVLPNDIRRLITAFYRALCAKEKLAIQRLSPITRDIKILSTFDFPIKPFLRRYADYHNGRFLSNEYRLFQILYITHDPARAWFEARFPLEATSREAVIAIWTAPVWGISYGDLWREYYRIVTGIYTRVLYLRRRERPRGKRARVL